MQSWSKSKLFSILVAITPVEWREFRNFIVSGIGGPSGRALELYEVLSDFHPDLHTCTLTREELYFRFSGQKTYEDKKLRYAMTDLYKLACSYLKIKALQIDGRTADLLLLEELAKRGADKAYLSEYQPETVANDMDLVKDAGFYFARHQSEYIHMNHFLPRQKRSDESPIGEATRFLDKFYIARKLQMLCAIINVQNVMAVNYDFFMRDELLEQLRNGAFKEVPLIASYFRVLMTLTEPENEVHFEELDHLLISSGNNFMHSDLRDMYQYQMNYCIKKINQGQAHYVNKLFRIYQSVLERKVIFNNGYLSQWDFKNIVVIGIRSGNHDWVFNFIESYKKFLQPHEQENAFVYNLAYYYFSIGDYRKALSQLRQVEFTDLYYQLDMRAILLKCYYEMDDEETFFYHIAAFRIFLNRNKMVSEYQRTIYRNMIKFTTALKKAAWQPDKLEALLQEINTVKQIADINWLRKKTEEKMKK
ncbi:MAG: hypothetical protein JNL49_14975 [Bacteroidia bacterium]|nr:hypothetical protein [Bacteroidia bacterium]